MAPTCGACCPHHCQVGWRKLDLQLQAPCRCSGPTLKGERRQLQQGYPRVMQPCTCLLEGLSPLQTLPNAAQSWSEQATQSGQLFLVVPAHVGFTSCYTEVPAEVGRLAGGAASSGGGDFGVSAMSSIGDSGVSAMSSNPVNCAPCAATPFGRRLLGFGCRPFACGTTEALLSNK